eukprot:jgi/Picre1/34029/NNA_001506.t1
MQPTNSSRGLACSTLGARVAGRGHSFPHARDTFRVDRSVVCEAGQARRRGQQHGRKVRHSGQAQRTEQGSDPNVMRLNKALASMGLASRRGADVLIEQGRIAINGKIVSEPGVTVNVLKDEIRYDGKIMTKTAVTNKYYFAMNKPKGYIYGWVAEWKRKHSNSSLAPRFFTHPSSGLTKEYSVTLNRRPGKLDLERMSKGYMDKENGVQVVPIAVALDDSDLSKRNRIRIIVAEGRNREVRNIVEAAGMEVKVCGGYEWVVIGYQEI